MILDLFSRKIVGLAIDDHMRADLVLGALRQAPIDIRRKGSFTILIRDPNIQAKL